MAGGAQRIQQEHALIQRDAVIQPQGVTVGQGHVLGIAAIGGPAQQARLVRAEVAAARLAVDALAAVARDVYRDAGTDRRLAAGGDLHHGAGDFVAWDKAKAATEDFAVRTADAVCGHFDEHLAGLELRTGDIDQFDHLIAAEISCTHDSLLH